MTLPLFVRTKLVPGLITATTALTFLAHTGTAAAACTALPTNEGTATFSVSIPANGTYRLWVHEYAPTSNDNGLYAQIDNTYCNVRVGDSSSIPAGTFTWVDYQSATPSNTIDLNLTAGTHNVTFAGLDPGVGIDKVLFLSDLTCTPTGDGGNCSGTSSSSTSTPPPSSGGGSTQIITPSASGSTSSTTAVSGTITLPNAPSGATRTYYLDGQPVVGNKVNTNILSDGNHTLTVVQRNANGKVQVFTQRLDVRNHPSTWSRVSAFTREPAVGISGVVILVILATGAVLWFVRPNVPRRLLGLLHPNKKDNSPLANAVVYSSSTRRPLSRTRLVVYGACFVIICGGALLYAAASSFVVSYSLPNASVSNGAVIVADAAAIGGKMVQFQSAAVATTPPPNPTPPPINPPSPPSTGVPAAGSYVRPGTVGYLGSQSTLTVYRPGGATPSGCSWQSYGLRCDQTNLTLDHVYVQGGLYWTGSGSLTITNSIMEGGLSWYAVYAAAATNDSNAVITVTDSTLRWGSSTEPAGQDVGPVWTRGTQVFDIERCDISGMPQGIDPGAGSLIKNNWIHDLNQNGTASTPSHIDGVYSQGGSNILVEGNYIDVPSRGDVTAALFIQDRGGTDTGIQIWGNYLSGGAYTLRNQTGINVDVENNTFGSSIYGTIGDLTGYPGTYGTWTGNVTTSGSSVAKP